MKCGLEGQKAYLILPRGDDKSKQSEVLTYRLWYHRHTVLHDVVIKVLIFEGQHSDQAVTDQSGEETSLVRKRQAVEERHKGRELCALQV